MASGLLSLNKNAKREPLRFGEDGKFRILQLTDIHMADPEMDDEEDRSIPQKKLEETMNVITTCIERAKPDLVVLTGDIVNGYWEELTYGYVAKIIERIVAPIKEKNIPLAVAFGNHDSELNFHREIQMCMYLDYENCRASLNAEEMHGCGTYNLTIKSSKSDKDAFNIWMFDSNDYPRDENGDRIREGGYDYVYPDQIAWYERTSKKLKEQNGGEPLPSILFQHIPVQQEYDLIESSETEFDGEYVGFCDSDGRYHRLTSCISGRLREFPCPPKDGHREQFDSWKKMGDIVAAYFGHDHTNDFIIDVDGILLCQTIGAGYWSYGNERGGRLIVLDENDPKNIYTETIEVEKLYK